MELHPGQAAIYDSPARFKIVAAGRRFGKSHLGAVLLGEGAMLAEHKGYKLGGENFVYYVAPTFDQAKRIMWPKLRNLLKYERCGGFIHNENVNDGWIELVNGRRIYVKGADNPDSLRGSGISRVVLDEYADMDPATWEEIIEPALMDVEGDALFIGTPKGKNHFYKLFMGALTKPADPVTGSSAHWNDWEAFHFKSLDNPFLKKEEVERQLRNPRKSRKTILQELDASFVSGAAKILKPDNFQIVDAPPEQAWSDGVVAVTVDLAGYKEDDSTADNALRDESCVAETLVVGDVWYVLDMQHGQWTVRETALRIVTAASKHAIVRLGIERGVLKAAARPYLDEYMRSFNRYFTPEPLLHGNTRKTDRIAWALQGRSEKGKIKLVRGPWNEWFLDQCADFPDPLAHDDGPDALAYVDQIATAVYADTSYIEEWQPQDLEAGY